MEDIIDQAKQEVEEAKRIWDEAVKIKKLPKQKEGIYNKKKEKLEELQSINDDKGRLQFLIAQLKFYSKILVSNQRKIVVLAKLVRPQDQFGKTQDKGDVKNDYKIHHMKINEMFTD